MSEGLQEKPTLEGRAARAFEREMKKLPGKGHKRMAKYIEEHNIKSLF